MRRLPRPRLTYANVAATLALVLAMSGGALAATHYLITSTKQISPKVLGALEGRQGPAGPQGQQGAAGSPGQKGEKGEPGGRGERGEKGEPGGPGERGEKGEPGERGERGEAGQNGEKGERGEKGEFGGPPGEKGEKGERGEQGPEGKPSGNAPHWRLTAEAGASKTSPTLVTLVEASPFRLVGHCYSEDESTYAETFITSSQSGAFVTESSDGEGSQLKAGEEVPVGTEAAEGENEEHEAAFEGPEEGLFSAESKSGGVALDGAANNGVFLKGTLKPACFFSGYIVSE